MLRLLLICGLSTILTWPVTVLADDPDGNSDATEPVLSVAEAESRRDGLIIGFDMFAGDGLEANASLAAGMGVQIGWMLSPTLALMLDTHGAAVGTSEVNAFNASSTVLVRTLAAASVQWWPTQRFWVRGGIGPGRAEGVTTTVGITPSAELEETQDGFGMSVATGYDLYRGALFSLDMHGRYSGIRAGGNGYSSVLLGLGFTWYP